MDLFDSLYNESIDEEKSDNVLLDEVWRRHFPSLHDFIVKRSHNGFKREHGRVTLTAENGLFKIIVADPTGQCSFGMLEKDIESCLRTMESHCATSAIHWYYWPTKNGGRKRSKKKHTHSTPGGDSNGR